MLRMLHGGCSVNLCMIFDSQGVKGLVVWTVHENTARPEVPPNPLYVSIWMEGYQTGIAREGET